jgi:hypothetical protein
MGVKGIRSNDTSNTKVSWNSTPIDKKAKEFSWSEDGKITIENEEFVAYRLFYNTTENMTCLYDIRKNVMYKIPSGSKAKGYMLAFKLNKIQ